MSADFVPGRMSNSIIAMLGKYMIGAGIFLSKWVFQNAVMIKKVGKFHGRLIYGYRTRSRGVRIQKKPKAPKPPDCYVFLSMMYSLNREKGVRGETSRTLQSVASDPVCQKADCWND